MSCLAEETIDRLVRGRLPDDQRAIADAHLAHCDSCIALVGLAASASGEAGPQFDRPEPAADTAARRSTADPGRLSPGTLFGRYTVLSLVGRGGMAEVYAAYDPELDRKVALKRIVDADAPGQAARLVREAKALARLSHPNVVAVHEVGTFGPHVFIAMEFVDGQTLAAWCAAGPRSWREILGVFLEAGRGLAAAHAAALVHRDFKPQNVMVRTDGQVRVMDFGLARSLAEATAEAPTMARAEGDARRPGDVAPRAAEMEADEPAARSDQLTRTGALVGTPLYMAPEQIRGETVDARTDQFSFCVSLYAALSGQHPFGGDRVSNLFANVLAGRLREPPTPARAPAWLQRVVLRGLRPAMAERWPSMDDLLRALERDPVRGRKRAATVGAAALLLVAATLTLTRSRTGPPSFCRDASARLRGVWEASPDGPVRGATQRAFLSTGRSYAESSFRTVSQLLDGYSTDWTRMYTEACEATHLRGEQSAEVLDLRMECLQGRLQSLRALTQVFSTADASVVENAVGAETALPAIGRCGDVELLRQVIQPPNDVRTRTKVADLERQIATVKALSDAGRCVEASRLAKPIVETARRVDYAPLLAEALDIAGWLGNDCLDAATAAAYAREAAGVAEAAHHDELAADASVLATTLLGERLAAFHDAEEWARHAEWKIKRIGGSPLLESWLDVAIGNALVLENRPLESLAAEKKALELKQQLFGPDHVDVARSLGNISYVLARLGRNQEALVAVDRALGIARKHLGGDHPLVARLEENRGTALLQAGRAAEAGTTFERALQVWRRSGSDESFQVEALIGAGESALAGGRPDEGIPRLERALEIVENAGGSPARLGTTRFAMAKALGGAPATRARARRLAQQARLDFARVPTLTEQVTEIDGWLAVHPARG